MPKPLGKIFELTANLGYSEAVKITVSTEPLDPAFFEVSAVSQLHFIVGKEHEHTVLYNAVITDELLARLDNPKEVWVYVE